MLTSGNTLEEVSLAAPAPGLGSETLVFSDTPGTVRILQSNTLHATASLLTPAATDDIPCIDNQCQVSPVQRN